MVSWASQECPNGAQLRAETSLNHNNDPITPQLSITPCFQPQTISQPQICCVRNCCEQPPVQYCQRDRSFGRCNHAGGAAPAPGSSQAAPATSNAPLKELQSRRDRSSHISSIATGRKQQCQPGASGTLGSGPISDLGLWDHSSSRRLMPPPPLSLQRRAGQVTQHSLGTGEFRASWGAVERRGGSSAVSQRRCGGSRGEELSPTCRALPKSSCICRSPEEAVTCCLQPVRQSLAFLFEWAVNKGLFSLYK